MALRYVLKSIPESIVNRQITTYRDAQLQEDPDFMTMVDVEMMNPGNPDVFDPEVVAINL